MRERAEETSESSSGLAGRLVDEGLRMEAFPGIVFRPGPSGRRAAVSKGPDVWEVISLVRSLDARGERAIAEAAEWLNLHAAEIRLALAYYGEFSDEIDHRIRANERAADRARRSWEAQQRIIG